jgi:hypothetical protein
MSKDFIRGSQVVLHSLRMFFQSLKDILVICLVISMIGSGIHLYKNSNFYPLKTSLLIQYFIAKFYDFMGSDNLIEFQEIHGQILQVPNSQYLAWYQAKILPKLLSLLKSSLFFGIKSFSISFLLIFVIFCYKGKKQFKSQYLRGIKLVKASKLKRQITMYNLKHMEFSPDKIGGFPYPKYTKYQHTIVSVQ